MKKGKITYPVFKFDDPYETDSYYNPKRIKSEMRDSLSDIYHELQYDIQKEHKCKIKLYRGTKKLLNRPPYIEFKFETKSGVREWIVRLQYIYLTDGLWFMISFPFNSDMMLIRPKDMIKNDFLAIMRGFIDVSLKNNGVGGEHKPTTFQILEKDNLYLKLLNKKIIKNFDLTNAFEE